ncbi:Alpha/beta hydrolase family protein [Anatilimnocola aggregata]|uniref:Alpha/beta hydrolase family protein n=1 Tax=Anatilimnocola aggregata TaxID=2528021 RepID=A0A517YNL5_9BACT|nr:alpha/beta fold hydrolase [Anatilimnocola aggregata]QDU31809.1 Alpha/beta hydrolase family protein [Anatilimnocola aggregata]
MTTAAPWQFGRLNRRGDTADTVPRCLVVFVPGLFSGWPRLEQYQDLLTLIDDTLSPRFAARDLLPVWYLATFWSPRDPDAIVREIIGQIDELTRQSEYDSLQLVSHSFGGLLALRLLQLAREKPWFAKLERALLLASDDRGLLPATRLQRLATSAGRQMGDWSFLDRCSLGWLRIGRLALAGLKPSPWLVELQQSSPTMPNPSQPRPAIFQILGELDRVVNATDAPLLAAPSGHLQIVPGARHRYFMLRSRWFEHPDPTVRTALAAVRQAVRTALLQAVPRAT